jgi:endogenous inhibitor of DNA gyrase (YacG/DUF329 family)
MTELRRCRWCRRALPEQQGRGRPRVFCSQRCRQWDWVSRQRAAELALSEGELVVTKASLDELHDDLYVLACAVDDADDDLAAELATARPRVTELRRIVANLLDAARPLRNRELPAPSPPTAISS